MKTLIASIVLLLVSALPAAAQPPAPSGPSVIVTMGEGVMKQAPDRAWVTMAAESRARTAQEAQRLNTDAMAAVVERLTTLIGPEPATPLRLS